MDGGVKIRSLSRLWRLQCLPSPLSLKAFNARTQTHRKNNPLLSLCCCFTLIFKRFVSGGVYCESKILGPSRRVLFFVEQSILSHLCKQLCINDVQSISPPHPLPLSKQKRIIHKKRREKIIRFVSPLSHFYSAPKFGRTKRQRKSVCSLATLASL